RIERSPLADQLGVGPWIDQLVFGNAREVIGGDVAHAVAGGLDRVHLDRGELGENLGCVFQSRPVELEVLARREMAVPSVILPADVRELAQLLRREHAIRNRDPQHRRVLLDVEAVLQAQGPEFVLGQLAGLETTGLVAKLRHPLVDEALVVGVVAIHDRYSLIAGYRPAYIYKRNVWRLHDSNRT